MPGVARVPVAAEELVDLADHVTRARSPNRTSGDSASVARDLVARRRRGGARRKTHIGDLPLSDATASPGAWVHDQPRMRTEPKGSREREPFEASSADSGPLHGTYTPPMGDTHAVRECLRQAPHVLGPVAPKALCRALHGHG